MDTGVSCHSVTASSERRGTSSCNRTRPRSSGADEKSVFVFQHHSGQFGLYYDVLCPGLVGEASGGGPRATSTILSRDRTFIPVPDEIAETFIPEAGERKRLEVRCDILYLDDVANGSSLASAK